MKTQILQKWEVIKESPVNERLPLPKIKIDHRATTLLKHANEAIAETKQEIATPLNLDQINQLIYATATTITEKLGKRPLKHRERKEQPYWKDKIRKEINELRKDLSILSEVEKGAQIKHWKKGKLERKLKIKNKEDIQIAK